MRWQDARLAARERQLGERVASKATFSTGSFLFSGHVRPDLGFCDLNIRAGGAVDFRSAVQSGQHLLFPGELLWKDTLPHLFRG